MAFEPAERTQMLKDFGLEAVREGNALLADRINAVAEKRDIQKVRAQVERPPPKEQVDRVLGRKWDLGPVDAPADVGGGRDCRSRR